MDKDVEALCVRLLALAEKQKDARGDMMYRGDADPEIVEAAAAIKALAEENEERQREFAVVTAGMNHDWNVMLKRAEAAEARAIAAESKAEVLGELLSKSHEELRLLCVKDGADDQALSAHKGDVK